jgi:hypothetical protein
MITFLISIKQLTFQYMDNITSSATQLILNIIYMNFRLLSVKKSLAISIL